MNNKRKQAAEETKPLLANEETPAPSETSVAAPVEAPVAETTPAETTVTVPEAPKETKMSMTLFCILGFLGAVFDFFYAPCTSLGNYGSIKMSPYGVFLIASAASFVTVWPVA